MGKSEARKLGLLPTLEEERSAGLRPSKAAGGRKGLSGLPATHVSDQEFVSVLMDSGLPLYALCYAFSAGSFGRLNALTAPILSSTPRPGSKNESVKKELRKISSGERGVCRNERFIRIKPLFWQLRGGHM